MKKPRPYPGSAGRRRAEAALCRAAKAEGYAEASGRGYEDSDNEFKSHAVTGAATEKRNTIS